MWIRSLRESVEDSVLTKRRDERQGWQIVLLTDESHRNGAEAEQINVSRKRLGVQSDDFACRRIAGINEWGWSGLFSF